MGSDFFSDIDNSEKIWYIFNPFDKVECEMTQSPVMIRS